MRTTDPNDPTLVHSAAFHHAGAFDVPLGFLGATTSAANSEAILEDLGGGLATFSRCIDSFKCEMPPFTFAGVSVTRRDPITPALNISELSLRHCGSTGSWTGSVCRLDIALFPLFGHLLIETFDKTTTRGCVAFWPPLTTLLQFVVYSTQTTVSDIPILDVIGAPRGYLVCAQDGCVYMGRTSALLSDDNVNDFVAQVAVSLNSITASASSRVQTLFSVSPALTIYEDIVLCEANVLAYMAEKQTALSELYGLAPMLSGMYTALRLSVYEYPAEWLFHAMKSTLLSLILPSGDLPAVDTSGMGSSPVTSLLWNSETREELCESGRLSARPTLYYLVCFGATPEYAKWTKTIDDPSLTIATLRAQARSALTSDILQNSMTPALVCKSKIYWNCDAFASYDPQYSACWNAAIQAQSDGGIDGVDPCVNSNGWFRTGDPKTVALDTADSSGHWSKFIASLSSTLDATADSSVLPVDYISIPLQNSGVPPLDVIHVAETSTIAISHQVSKAYPKSS